MLFVCFLCWSPVDLLYMMCFKKSTFEIDTNKGVLCTAKNFSLAVHNPFTNLRVALCRSAAEHVAGWWSQDEEIFWSSFWWLWWENKSEKDSSRLAFMRLPRFWSCMWPGPVQWSLIFTLPPCLVVVLDEPCVVFRKFAIFPKFTTCKWELVIR